jgi:hypothetical protein
MLPTSRSLCSMTRAWVGSCTALLGMRPPAAPAFVSCKHADSMQEEPQHKGDSSTCLFVTRPARTLHRAVPVIATKSCSSCQLPTSVFTVPVALYSSAIAQSGCVQLRLCCPRFVSPQCKAAKLFKARD